jgi:hypothetical protein
MVFVLLVLPILSGCKSRKEAIYIWQNEDEHQRLILKRDNSFVLEIDAGYYLRIDTGTFIQRGDTIVLNPDKEGNVIDSLVEMDSLFYGHRFLEVMEPEVSVSKDNEITKSFVRAILFPMVIINDSIPLSLNPDDQSYSKLLIPDSLDVYRILIRVPEEKTCKPELTFKLNLHEREKPAKSFRIYIRSHDTRELYLAGFKWLLKGDTVETTFMDEWCSPIGVKLVRSR